MEDLGFDVVSEIASGEDDQSIYVDVLFEIGKSRFILELKISKKSNQDTIIRGIVQAYRYSLIHNTKNILVISYPASVTEDLSELSEAKHRTLKTQVEAIILTEQWHHYVTKLTVEEILSNLKSKIEQKLTSERRVETASIVIRKCVSTLSRLLNKYYKNEKDIEEAARHLTKDYGLFIEGQSPRSGKIRNQTIDLLAYILVNQIVFYFLYSKKTLPLEGIKKVEEIKRLRYLGQVEYYFNQIRAIDYRPIFDVHVVEKIPSAPEVLEVVNDLIECLTPLEVSEMKHDLYGRLIGNSLPFETRKILASYYTKPQSADFLTGLTISRYDETGCDLACGSGTLLVSSYDMKLKLYRKEKQRLDESDVDKLHSKFVENQLTGMDIMPFACHLSALNLCARNLNSQTSVVRVANMNSLSLHSFDKSLEVEEAYGDIATELSRVTLPQQTLDIFTERKPSVTSIPARKFIVEKVDFIVINPPFTNINKLPDEYRKNSLTSSPLSVTCGKRAAPWCYFLAIAYKILKEGGRVGAIIPISFLKGKDTEGIRNFCLNNLTIEYVIKPAPGS